MTEGIDKKELEKKKASLDQKIRELERAEIENTAMFHKATAEKYRLRKDITEAKQERLRIIALIEECKEF